MQDSQVNRIPNFIWGIADDVLRDLYVRGKYRDIILPMTVIRRLDAALEPTKQAVLDMGTRLDDDGVIEQEAALKQAAGHAFYNASPFTLRDLRARANRQQLRADFEAYLDGFSSNVQDILKNFEFRNQIPRLSDADVLGALIENFCRGISISVLTRWRTAMVLCGFPVWTIMRWVRFLKNWCGGLMRRITRRLASTGRRAMRSS